MHMKILFTGACTHLDLIRPDDKLKLFLNFS